MKKALQIPRLRGICELVILYQTKRLARAACERQRSGPGDDGAELLVLDLRRPGGSSLALLQSNRRRPLWGRLAGVGAGLRQRPGDELQGGLARQARADLRGPLAELEATRGVLRVGDERPVTLEARRPRVAGDLGADRGRPGLEHLTHPRVRAVAAELTFHLIAERLDRAPPLVSPAAAGGALRAASRHR